MGLLKGPLTFTRFKVSGESPPDFTEMLDSQIRKYAFRKTGADSQEKIMGWTGIMNPLDTDFSFASYAWGGYLLFSLRVDRCTIPPSLLSIRALEAEKRYLLETGRKKADKTTRGEIREKIRRELMELIPATPSFYELCWSAAEGDLLFTSMSEKVLQDFQDLFKACFNLTPVPFAPWETQWLDAGTDRKIEALEKIEVGGIGRKSLGREFLGWLWFKSEERNGTIAIPGGGETELHFVRRLVLESGEGDYAESVMCQGMHTDLREGREALRRGKKIREARIELTRDAATWEFTFKADRFQFQSLKMPAVMDDEDSQESRDSRVLERIYLLETVVRLMEQLFGFYLSLRLSDVWSAERMRMDKWLQTV